MPNAIGMAGGVGGAIGSLLGGPLGGLLLSMGPGVLAKMFGYDPQKTLRDRVGMLSSPESLAKFTAQNYQNLQGGPAFQQALGNIAAGGNATSNLISSELGARGIGTSGTGAILSSITPSIVGSQQAQLRTATQATAAQQAQQQIQQMIAALMGTQGPSASAQLLGGGLEAFGPLLQRWLSQRAGGAGGNGTWQPAPQGPVA